MKAMFLSFATICLALAAVNVVFYFTAGHHWWSLAVAAFVGAVGVWHTRNYLSVKP